MKTIFSQDHASKYLRFSKYRLYVCIAGTPIYVHPYDKNVFLSLALTAIHYNDAVDIEEFTIIFAQKHTKRLKLDSMLS